MESNSGTLYLPGLKSDGKLNYKELVKILKGIPVSSSGSYDVRFHALLSPGVLLVIEDAIYINEDDAYRMFFAIFGGINENSLDACFNHARNKVAFSVDRVITGYEIIRSRSALNDWYNNLMVNLTERYGQRW